MPLPPELTEKVEALKIREGERMLECRCRNRSGCTLINARLGWWHGMPLDDCDVCMALGGEKSPEASQFREKYAMGIIGAHTRTAYESIRKPDREILVALTVLHGTVSEHRFAAPDIQNAVKGRVRWVTVKKTWEKAVSLAKSLGSWFKWDGLSEKDRNLRQIACFGETMSGERVGPSCQMLGKSETSYHCTACGCGSTELSKLGDLSTKGREGYSKLNYPHLECPLAKEGFANARRL